MPPLDDDDLPAKTGSGPSAKERMAERASKAKPDLDTDEDAPVIDVSGRDDDDDDDEPAPKTSVRAEKKRNRYREMSERADAAERSRAESDARFSQMVSLYQKTLEVQSQATRQGTPEKDEHDTRLEGIYREQELLYTELQAKARTLTQQDKDRIEKRARELDAEKIQVAVQKHMRANGGGQQSHGTADTMQAMLQLEYPDVVANSDALGWAQAYYQMQRKEGRAASLDLARDAMSKAKQRFRIGGADRRPAPAASAREKYAGVGRGGAGRDPDADREEVVMSKPFRRMANAKYPLIKDEKERMKMWANGPGKRLLASQRAAKHSA